MAAKKLQQNTAYDAMVRELLTQPMNGQGQNPYGQQQGEPTAIAFYLAKEVKPENLAAASSRLFLGVKIECAQCHNHPFASGSAISSGATPLSSPACSDRATAISSLPAARWPTAVN